MAILSQLEIKAAIKIGRPQKQVFDAIVEPGKMKNYFIAQGSGNMEEGKTITWKFAEMDIEFPVQVLKVQSPSYISFSWSDAAGNATTVQMNLEKRNGETFVSITEGKRENNEEGIKWLMGNTEGWANFLACLKAYLEYGINLRKGAFDISQIPVEEKTNAPA